MALVVPRKFSEYCNLQEKRFGTDTTSAFLNFLKAASGRNLLDVVLPARFESIETRAVVTPDDQEPRNLFWE